MSVYVEGDGGGGVVKEQLIQQWTNEHPTFGCSFAYAGLQTQCAGTVRIIEPSCDLWLLDKLEFVELIIPCTTAKRQELFAPVILLSCRIQHILYKNSVSPRRVSHQHMVVSMIPICFIDTLPFSSNNQRKTNSIPDSIPADSGATAVPQKDSIAQNSLLTTRRSNSILYPNFIHKPLKRR